MMLNKIKAMGIYKAPYYIQNIFSFFLKNYINLTILFNISDI